MLYAPLRYSWRRLTLADGSARADHMAVATLGSAADVWSRRAPVDYKKMAVQLVERSGPAFLVFAATLLVAQARMCECELGPLGNGAKPDLDKRLAGIFDAARPAPTHAHPLRLHDLEIFAAALMLGSVEHAEAYPEAATNPRLGLRHKHRAAVWAPPAGDAFRCGERIEDDRRPRLDPAHERQTGHRLFFLA